MASFDGGHYFLTALSSVLADPMPRADGSLTSPTASLREALASLPTAQQSEACVKVGHKSPFSRCHRTHFARLVVIDQPAFNGRDPGNAIVQSLKRTPLLKFQPVDALTTSWLLLGIDFDAGPGDDHGRHDYLAGLWSLMSAELTDVYRHCHGFDRVTDGDSFARYIERCEVETTMPFNDYFMDPPKLPTLTMAGVGALLLGITLGATLLGWAAARWAGISGWWALLAVPIGLAIALRVAFGLIGARGDKLFPTAPDSDLRSVLKALHVQQRFVDFAADQQGSDAATLHAAFATFVAELKPESLDAPTQPPGVVRS